VIFASVGNARQGFPRLVRALDELAGEGALGGEDILVQTGHDRTYTSRHARTVPFLSPADFEEHLRRCDVFVTHGGFGSVLQALQERRRPVVMPRLRALGEAVNDHQRELAAELGRSGRVVLARDKADLPASLAMARQPLPPATDDSRPRLVDLLAQALDEVLGGRL
jgi:UDP-N-acetylglucosamine transferase subunit ALG13